MTDKDNQTCYIFVSGGVMSGLGKGIVAASIASLIKAYGYKVTPVKFENYLNVDAGTINPIEHGDPFLCADGTEADMDLGSYERFLQQEMGKTNFVTMGRIYYEVIQKERSFGYKGEDVEAIPHVVDHIISKIDQAVEKDGSKIAVIELGGTTGEYQNVLYYEANRLLKYKYPERVIHVHVSYVPIPRHLGEPKTKPVQMSVKMLNSMAIQPDFLVARSPVSLDDRRRQRLSLFCSLNPEHIINNPDVNEVYQLPLIFHKQKFGLKILNQLKLKPVVAKPKLMKWAKLEDKIKTAKQSRKRLNITIVGKYFATGDFHLTDAYIALIEALKHAKWQLGYDLHLNFIQSTRLEGIKNSRVDQLLSEADGLIVPIGWGSRGVEGKIKAIQYARENKLPFLGLCYGMQLAVVEFARHVAGLAGADTVEKTPDTPHPVIHLMSSQEEVLANQVYGGTMRLGEWLCQLSPESQTTKIYQTYQGMFIDKSKLIISERHRHRYEFNDDYAQILTKHGLVIAGRSVNEGLVEMIELPPETHPFFIATQGHPEYKSTPFKPHPLFLAFLQAGYQNKK